jgi:hypothetical protein
VRAFALAALLLVSVGCASRSTAHGLLLELPAGYRGLVRVVLDDSAPMPEARGDDWIAAVPRAGTVRLHTLPAVSGWRGVRCAWSGGHEIPPGDPTNDDAVACWDLGQLVRSGAATSAHDLLIGTRIERDAARAAPEGFEVGDTATLRRYHALAGIGRAALRVGDAETTVAAGTELLALADEFRGWDYGNAIHDGNELLGLAALRAGDVSAADAALLAAGATPGSARLMREGPSLRLARELSTRGERATVLKYLDQCARFWGDGRERIAAWKDALRAGLDPDFGPNSFR